VVAPLALRFGEAISRIVVARCLCHKKIRRLSSEDQEFLLFLDLARMAAAAFTIGGNNCWFVALVRAGPCIGIAGLNIDKSLLAEFGEIGASRRFQAL
jgi:hypothetical protein